MTTDHTYKSFFWKRFFILFIPLFIIGLIFEPYITQNTFSTLEDVGEFTFFLVYNFIVFGMIAAILTEITWRVKRGKRKN